MSDPTSHHIPPYLREAKTSTNLDRHFICESNNSPLGPQSFRAQTLNSSFRLKNKLVLRPIALQTTRIQSCKNCVRADMS